MHARTPDSMPTLNIPFPIEPPRTTADPTPILVDLLLLELRLRQLISWYVNDVFGWLVKLVQLISLTTPPPLNFP